MPNIAPRGLWGLKGAGWAAAVDLWVSDGASFAAVDLVYVWDGSAWQVVWSRTAGSPSSAAASFAGSAVTVTWVASSPLIAEGYNVRRPDGTLAGYVSGGTTLSLTDPDPRPLNGAYKVYGVLAGVESEIGTATNVLDLRLTPPSYVPSVLSGGTPSATVRHAWTLPAAGQPDQWRIYGTGGLIATVAGNVTQVDLAVLSPGSVNDFTVTPVLSSVEGVGAAGSVAVPAAPPTGATLTATNPPISNLRLAWSAPLSGSVSGYEVERSTDGSTWEAHETVGAAVTVSDWATTVQGYMRVRATSTAGPSAWATAGPTAPINDVVPPADATIVSFKPEASYGRMVLRFTTPPDADFAAYLVQSSPDGTTWTDVGSWTTAAPSTSAAVVTGTYVAGQTPQARVLVRDAIPNERTGAAQSYTLAVSPIIVDPSGQLSGTYRAETGGWRNDGTRSTTEIATGDTSSGHNIGCFFYGATALADALTARTVVSAKCSYWRENEGGLGSSVKPEFWGHQLTSRSGAPVPNDCGVSTSDRLAAATGVARTGTTSGSFTLPAAFIAAIIAGTVKGLCMARTAYGTDYSGISQYYMLCSIGGTAGGSPSVVNGRVTITHLG